MLIVGDVPHAAMVQDGEERVAVTVAPRVPHGRVATAVPALPNGPPATMVRSGPFGLVVVAVQVVGIARIIASVPMVRVASKISVETSFPRTQGGEGCTDFASRNDVAG